MVNLGLFVWDDVAIPEVPACIFQTLEGSPVKVYVVLNGKPAPDHHVNNGLPYA